MKSIRSIAVLALILIGSLPSTAQTDSVWQAPPTLRISGFADVFYAFDFGHPPGPERQPFLFNHNRQNEWNINQAIIRLELEHPKYRANLALQTGTYAQDNYAAEPEILRHIFEGNIGISLSGSKYLWLDAGVFPSHIGFESAVSTDNWTLTRSLLAENSPYFETGVRLTYQPDSRWEFAGLLLNGWQRIQRQAGNSLPAFGTQIRFRPNDRLTLNWSSFTGSDDPDENRRIRHFHNFYAQFQCSERIGLIAGFDLGAQQRRKNSSVHDFWLSPVLIGQYVWNARWKTAVRAEYYQDRSGIMIPTDTENGFATAGMSINVDYSPAPPILCRMEVRYLGSQDEIFQTREGLADRHLLVAASMAVRFVKQDQE